MSELRFGVIGTGFWARYQLAAWQEVEGARCVALYNRTRAKAEQLAAEFNIPAVYHTAEELLLGERPDFVDVITDVNTHRHFVELAAAHKVAVVCQKPLGPTLADARAMTAFCDHAKVPLLVHENWRWQKPLRELKRVLDSGTLGPIFRARVTYSNSFPVFDNQPFLKELEQFILMDIGTHILDTARMLFGEAHTVFCRTHRVRKDICGEDVATVMLGMDSGATVTCEMSYASRLEHDRFPETYACVEAADGCVELGPDFWLRVTTTSGTQARRCPPPSYPWTDPRYALVQAAGVDCNRDLLGALQDQRTAETRAHDNLKTLELVFGAYDSARSGRAVRVGPLLG